jgi:hypothetical protein
MAQFTIYRSSDTSAPTLSGTAGDLVNVLDKCLVAGYGAKAAAGWSKPYTGANKAAFRPGAGTRFYLRVQDDAPGVGVARECRLNGYEVMSDVDTGTGPFPSSSFLTGRKSTDTSATTRTWLVVADNRTAYVCVLTGDTAQRYFCFAFGDFYSFINSDQYNCMLIGRTGENAAPQVNSEHMADLAVAPSGVLGGHHMARGHTGLGGAVNFGKHGDSAKSGSLTYINGILPFTNPSDGGLYLSRIWVHDPATTPVNGIRGRLRGLWHFLHPLGSVADGDTINGVGELAGKSFLFVRNAWAYAGNDAILTFETSDTLETN